MPIAVIFPLVPPPYIAATGEGKAAGGGGRPFAKVESREVFLRTVELYAPRDQVIQRIVVVPPDDLQTVQERYAAHLGFQGVIVAGGTSDWFGCVARGLARLEEAEKTGTPIADTLILHDPCCPAVPFPLLDALEAALAKDKACAGVIAVLPSASAFADLEGRLVSEYVDMSKTVQVQSPQIFRRKPLVEAYAKRTGGGSGGGGQVFVDDAELLLAAGHKISTIPGSRLNQRIDSEEMSRLARDLIEHLPKPKPKTPLNPFGEAEW